MKFADRLKFTATGTSAATITVGAAATGCRTLAQVIADSTYDPNGIRVGDLYVPFTVEDGAGNQQISLYKITSATQIDLIAILSSSNGGNAVTFSGPLTVYNSDVAWALNYGLTNPHDPGFDIILLLGQSNMVGQDAHAPLFDVVSDRIFAYGCYYNEASTYRKITQAVDPLRHNYAQATMPGSGNNAGLGPGSWLARTYARSCPTNRTVLLVPCARSSTKLFADTREWFPGDGTAGSGVALGAAGSTLLDNAIDQCTRAVAEAQLLYPSSRVVGVAWHQGEGDADYYGLNLQLNYQGALKTLIQSVRTRIPTAASSWFVIGGLMGENVADTSGHPGYASVDNAHRNVAAEVARCAYTPGLTGYKMGDNLHYTAAGARILGCNMASVIPVAMLSRGIDTTAPVTRSATVYAASPSVVAVALSEPYDPAYPTQASAWTVSGHAVSSVNGSGNYIYLNLSTPFVGGEAQRTVIYTAPGSNGLRDLAGNVMANQTAINITNNAPAVDTQAPTLTSATATATGPNSANGAVTTNEANGTLYYYVSSNSIETQATVKANGATQAITSAGSKAVSVTGLTASTSYYLHYLHRDAAGNDSAVLDSASFTTTAVDSQAPNLSSPVGTATGSSTATATVSTDEANGTLYYMVSINAVETAATIKTGSSKAVTATGVQNVAFTGLTASTTYYSHFLHKDAAGNESAVVNGPGFTTQASSGSDLRFTSLTNMTETSSVAPYAYKTNSAIGYNNTNNGGMSVLAAADAFSIKVQIGGGVANAKPMLSVRNSSAIGPYGTALANFFASGTYSAYSGSISNPTSINASVVPADSNWMQVSRAAGSNVLKGSVSQDGGNTWIDVCTWPGVTGTVYVQIQSQGNGTFTAPQGTGFA